jgi:hypothetical protein
MSLTEPFHLPRQTGLAEPAVLSPALAHREWIARRARHHLAAYLSEESQTEQGPYPSAKADSADDINFGRSDCEFLFRD